MVNIVIQANYMDKFNIRTNQLISIVFLNSSSSNLIPLTLQIILACSNFNFSIFISRVYFFSKYSSYILSLLNSPPMTVTVTKPFLSDFLVEYKPESKLVSTCSWAEGSTHTGSIEISSPYPCRSP